MAADHFLYSQGFSIGCSRQKNRRGARPGRGGHSCLWRNIRERKTEPFGQLGQITDVAVIRTADGEVSGFVSRDILPVADYPLLFLQIGLLAMGFSRWYACTALR
mgnify:CR=1 FL=1